MYLILFVWESQTLAHPDSGGLGLIIALAADVEEARRLAYKAAADWPGGPGIPNPDEHERFVAAIVEETRNEPRTVPGVLAEPRGLLIEGAS